MECCYLYFGVYMYKIYCFIKIFMVSCLVLLGGFFVVDVKVEIVFNI